MILINIKINPHDISALRVAHGSYAACIFYFSYISRMLKMIHYLFCIHSFCSSITFLFNRLFCLFLYEILIKRGHTAQLCHNLF